MISALLRLAILPVLILVIGFLLPENLMIPVKGASPADWHPDSFWHYPWGKSVVHKGIDIFHARGTPVVAPTYGLVVFAGNNGRGGKAVIMLGPKWRYHYFAHLNEYQVKSWQLVHRGSKLGTVGSTGNAAGKPPHLHYAIITPIPYPWRADDSPQGWRKMHFLDPDQKLREAMN